MTGRRPPRRPSGGPGGFDDVPELSPEEVERRVDLRGGGAPHGPIQRPVRDLRAPRRRSRSVARDSLLLVGLAVIGLVAIGVLLPDGPLDPATTSGPGSSEVAIVSAPVGTGAPSRTPGVQTLPPAVGPSLDPNATALPPNPATASSVPTTASGPTPTPRPGPTPRPTGTAKPPTPGPTPTAPNTATVIVILDVENNSGGSATASDWTMVVTVEGGFTAIPSNFAGTEAGQTVTIPAGKGYSVGDDGSQPGYAGAVKSPGCVRAAGSGGLAAGTSVTCTVTRYDSPRVNVETLVNGGPAIASQVDVTVSGANASPSSFPGSESGTLVVVGSGLTYSVTMTNLVDYTKSNVGACGPTSLDAVSDPIATCTFTFDYVEPPATEPPATEPPTTEPPTPSLVLPLAFLPILFPRRWRTTRAG